MVTLTNWLLFYFRSRKSKKAKEKILVNNDTKNKPMDQLDECQKIIEKNFGIPNTASFLFTLKYLKICYNYINRILKKFKIFF